MAEQKGGGLKSPADVKKEEMRLGMMRDSLSTKELLLNKERLRLGIIQDSLETVKDPKKKEELAKQAEAKSESVKKLEKETADLGSRIAEKENAIAEFNKFAGAAERPKATLDQIHEGLKAPTDERLKTAEQLMKDGIALHDQGKFVEAIAAFDGILIQSPKNADAWYNKGKALSKMDRSKEAKECFNRANELVGVQAPAPEAKPAVPPKPAAAETAPVLEVKPAVPPKPAPAPAPEVKPIAAVKPPQALAKAAAQKEELPLLEQCFEMTQLSMEQKSEFIATASEVIAAFLKQNNLRSEADMTRYIDYVSSRIKEVWFTPDGRITTETKAEIANRFRDVCVARLLSSGDRFFSAGKFKDALTTFTSAARIDPTSKEAKEKREAVLAAMHGEKKEGAQAPAPPAKPAAPQPTPIAAVKPPVPAAAVQKPAAPPLKPAPVPAPEVKPAALQPKPAAAVKPEVEASEEGPLSIDERHALEGHTAGAIGRALHKLGISITDSDIAAGVKAVVRRIEKDGVALGFEREGGKTTLDSETISAVEKLSAEYAQGMVKPPTTVPVIPTPPATPPAPPAKSVAQPPKPAPALVIPKPPPTSKEMEELFKEVDRLVEDGPSKPPEKPPKPPEKPATTKIAPPPKKDSPGIEQIVAKEMNPDTRAGDKALRSFHISRREFGNELLKAKAAGQDVEGLISGLKSIEHDSMSPFLSNADLKRLNERLAKFMKDWEAAGKA